MREYTNSELVTRLQDAQFSILKELDRVCNILELPYCLAFGSALGAIRHKGFIPWDDDIDVYMKAEDLQALSDNCFLFKNEFFLQNSISDPDYRLMISRLRNSETTLIEENEANRDINHGIFIDIYPLFNSPKDGLGAKRLIILSMLYRLMLYGDAPKNRGGVMKLGASVLLRVIPEKLKSGIATKCYRKMTNARHTGYLSSLYGDEVDVRYQEEWIFPAKRVPFEDETAPVAADPDKYLTATYGDYMTLPPEEKRQFHHNYLCVDFQKSYREYKGIFYCKG